MVNIRHLFRLEDISKYRSAMMGVAILLVLCHHFTITLPILRNASENGFVGVDMFIFLSGFGLYYSYGKNSTKTFYVRRFSRIFISYLLFGIAFSFVLAGDGINDFLLKVSTTGFWLGKKMVYYEWFVPSIVVLYVIYPIVYSIVKTNFSSFIILVTVMFSTVACFTKLIPFPYYFLVGRLSAYMLGAYCANCLVSDKPFRGLIIVALIGLVVAIISELLVQGDIHIYYWGRTFLLPALIVVACALFRIIPTLDPLFARLGSFTLEIYLAHLLILRYDYFFRTNAQIFPDLITLLECVLSIIIGWGMSWMVSGILEKYRYIKL